MNHWIPDVIFSIILSSCEVSPPLPFPSHLRDLWLHRILLYSSYVGEVTPNVQRLAVQLMCKLPGEGLTLTPDAEPLQCLAYQGKTAQMCLICNFTRIFTMRFKSLLLVDVRGGHH